MGSTPGPAASLDSRLIAPQKLPEHRNEHFRQTFRVPEQRVVTIAEHSRRVPRRLPIDGQAEGSDTLQPSLGHRLPGVLETVPPLVRVYIVGAPVRQQE